MMYAIYIVYTEIFINFTGFPTNAAPELIKIALGLKVTRTCAIEDGKIV